MVDVTPPQIASTSPTNGALNVNPFLDLSVMFDEPVMPIAGNIEIHKTSDDSLVKSIAIDDPLDVSFQDDVVFFDLTGDLAPDTSYYVIIAAGVIEDVEGNDFAGISSKTAFQFTTWSTPTSTGSFVNDSNFDVTTASVAVGVATSDAAFQFTNSGTFHVSGGDYAYGLYADNGATVHNSNVFEVIGGSVQRSVGFTLFGTSVLDNSGSITVTDDTDDSAAVVFIVDDFSQSVFTNTGTITADNAFLEVQPLGIVTHSGFVLTNSGVINGSISVSLDDTQVVDPIGDVIHNTGSIVGNILFGIGNDLFDGASGSLDGRLDGYDGNDTLRAGTGDSVVLGGNGDDLLEGGPGSDFLMGGDGIDTVSYSGSTAAVSVNLSSGTASGSATGFDLVREMENVIGGAGNDTLTGDGSDNALSGGNGDDLLIGAAGADTLTGDAGTDTASYADSSAAVTVNLGTGTGTGGDAEGDTLTTIEKLLGSGFGDTLFGNLNANVIDGGNGNDTLAGGAGADTLTGGAGDDLLIGGLDADVLDGGAGVNTASYDDNLVGVTVNLGLSTGPDGDTLISIQNLVGSHFDDTLFGNIFDNVLDGGLGNNALGGGAGNDTLNGSIGNDTLIGGTGADILNGGGGLDTASYDDNPVGVTVNLGLSTGPDGDTLTSIENLVGSHFDDTLFGNGADNVLDGGLGNNTLGGGAGNDTLNGSIGDDTLIGGTGADILNGGGGTDTASYDDNPVAVTVNLGLSTGPDGDTLNSIENLTGSHFDDTLFGNGADNVLDGGLGNNALGGGAGNDTLNGSIGNDTLIGGTGADILNGGGGTDTASYDDNPVAVTVNLGLSTGPDGDTLTSIENLTGSHFDDTLFGNPSDNVISGGLGNNTLAGGAGNDTLNGSIGNDTLIGGTGADVLNGGDGTDTASYDDNPVLVTVNLGLSTGPDGDTLSSIENLVGSHFADTLFGNAANNVLEGRLGNDTLGGGGGVDTFVFIPGGGADTVTDFVPDTDKISLDNVAGFQGFGGTISFLDLQAVMTQAGADAVIDLGFGDTITLIGVDMNLLHATDFLL